MIYTVTVKEGQQDPKVFPNVPARTMRDAANACVAGFYVIHLRGNVFGNSELRARVTVEASPLVSS